MRSRSISAWNSLVLPPSTSDVGDAGHDAQLALDHPVLQRLEPHDVHARRPRQLVAEDLADAAGGRDHRLHAGRQHRILQPVEGLLAHEMIVAAVFELQADEAERVDGVGADELQPGVLATAISIGIVM
jgi:hypothetical protein